MKVSANSDLCKMTVNCTSENIWGQSLFRVINIITDNNNFTIEICFVKINSSEIQCDHYKWPGENQEQTTWYIILQIVKWTMTPYIEADWTLQIQQQLSYRDVIVRLLFRKQGIETSSIQWTVQGYQSFIYVNFGNFSVLLEHIQTKHFQKVVFPWR